MLPTYTNGSNRLLVTKETGSFIRCSHVNKKAKTIKASKIGITGFFPGHFLLNCSKISIINQVLKLNPLNASVAFI